jgi:hypothetical protein
MNLKLTKGLGDITEGTGLKVIRATAASEKSHFSFQFSASQPTTTASRFFAKRAASTFGR